MKKIVSILLILVFVIALTSCGEAANTANATKTTTETSAEKGFNFAKLEEDKYAGQFRVGFARVDITPEDTRVPMAGYGNSPYRIAQGILSKLYVHCIAVSDEDNNTVFLMQVDNIGTGSAIAKNIYAGIKKRTGVPEDNIVYCCTHTHSAPDSGYTQFPSIAMYVNFFTNSIVNAAILAMNDRSPCSNMYYGSVNIPNHSFVRHYWASVNGEVRAVGDNHNMAGWYSEASADSKKLLSHISANDQTCHIVKFDRTDETKKDVMFLSFRCHPHLMGSQMVKTHFQMTADCAGMIVEKLEDQIDDVYCCYIQGSAGDLNPKSYFPNDGSYPEEVYTEDFRVYAETFDEYVMSAYGNLRDIGTGKVGGKAFDVTVEYNHDWDGYLSRAYLVQDYWKSHQNDTAGTQRYAMSLGIFSQYHASKIIQNSQAPAEHNVNHRVLAIGNVGFTCTSGELFNQLGVKACETNPFDVPIAVAYTGGMSATTPAPKLTITVATNAITTVTARARRNAFLPRRKKTLKNCIKDLISERTGDDK